MEIRDYLADSMTSYRSVSDRCASGLILRGIIHKHEIKQLIDINCMSRMIIYSIYLFRISDPLRTIRSCNLKFLEQP